MNKVADWVARAGFRPVHYLLLVLVHERLFLSGARAGANDWRYVFYPWADALRITLLRFHQFPWWNPWSVSGQPLFADPQAPVLVPDTLLVLGFGAVIGLKLVIFFYQCVGYEGSRFLCRDLFGESRFVQAMSVIPALFPALPLHFNEGHIVFVVFLLFPWLLALALSWERSTARALGLGVVVAWHLLSYIHYSVIISLTIAGPIAATRFVRAIRAPETWLRAGLVSTAILGLAYLRLAMTLPFLAHFPRTEPSRYPIVATLHQVAQTLVQPLQDRDTKYGAAGLNWWEMDTYVGVFGIGLAAMSLRRWNRRGMILVAAAVLCLLAAWNNRDAPFPSYYLHWIRPWDHMVVITRWRLYGGFFLLVAAVAGLVSIHDERPRLAVALALLTMLDLGFHAHLGFRRVFRFPSPEYGNFDAPPVTVHDKDDETWSDVRANRVSMGAQVSVLGYGSHYPARDHVGTASYDGDYPGATVREWSPNHVVLEAPPGSTLRVNTNPSSYWMMDGVRLFPAAREFEIAQPFTVVVPASGRVDLRAEPPGLSRALLVQSLCAALAVALFFVLRARDRRSGVAGRRA